MVKADVPWVGIDVYPSSLLEQDLSSAQGTSFPLGRGLQFRGALGLVHDARSRCGRLAASRQAILRGRVG